MSALPPNATSEQIEEELLFLEVLIESLDAGADDYAERLESLDAQKEELEARRGSSEGESRQQTSYQQQNHMENHMSTMDGADDSSNAFWQTTLNGRPASNDGLAPPSFGAGPSANNFDFGMNDFQPSYPRNPMKRTLPFSMQSESLHPSKRPTPDPSNAGTPASSNDSFELIDRPPVVQRQIAREEALRKQREAQARDELFARALQQQQSTSSLQPVSSSSRPNIQTTLNYNGSFQRPPESIAACQSSKQRENYGNVVQYPHLPNMAGAMIKPEPGLPVRQELPQRSRAVPDFIDLTNSDDEEDISEIDRTRFTPNRRTENTNNFNRSLPPRPQLPQLPQVPQIPQMPQIPGTYPTMNANGYQPVYGNNNIANITAQARYPWLQQQTHNPLLSGARSAVNGIQQAASTISSTFQDLHNLINGSGSRSHVFDGDDDDIIYGGTRQIPGPSRDPYAGYSDMDQYNERRAAYENYNPLKSTEEINALLANIRPDEELPAHLRVQTPEAMAIRLHKYQELGLTWLYVYSDSDGREWDFALPVESRTA